MKRLGACIKADMKLQVKYGLYTVYIIITILYLLILKQFPKEVLKVAVPFLIFSDPSFLGFFFIGGLILFEKDENTLDFIAASPIRPQEYLLSKVISLMLLALAAGISIATLTYGDLNYLFLAVGIAMTSFFFTLIGFIAVSKFKTVNQYILSSIIYLILLSLPILDYFNILKSPVFYIFPTFASLKLIGSAFSSITLFDFVYSILYLTTSIVVAYKISYRRFYRYIILKEGEE